jgi:hypothetical protein
MEYRRVVMLALETLANHRAEIELEIQALQIIRMEILAAEKRQAAAIKPRQAKKQ